MKLLILLSGCAQNYHVTNPPTTPPAEPPGETLDAFGNAPDWATCGEAYAGWYYNLTDDPEALAIGDDGPEVVTPGDVDWWDAANQSFVRADTSLVMGSSWWPVDDGLSGDPDYFAVRWTAWFRSEHSGDVTFALTAATDAWVYLGDTLVADIEASPTSTSQTFDVSVDSGVYKLDIRFAQRVARESAFRFRAVSEDIAICYPDFSSGDSGG